MEWLAQGALLMEEFVWLGDTFLLEIAVPVCEMASEIGMVLRDNVSLAESRRAYALTLAQIGFGLSPWLTLSVRCFRVKKGPATLKHREALLL